jgi:very-short-patch-repair endonuclease
MTKEHNYASRSLIQRARELRRDQTSAEGLLWNHLRSEQLGYKFRRQHPIGRFIADFYCHQARLVVEADGDVHDGRQEQDAVRSEWLSERGYRVIRFSNEQIRRELASVLEAIKAECERGTPSP